MANDIKRKRYCELLALRYRRGDASALEELIKMWEQPLFYYVRRLTDSEEDAWDCLQETWIKVMRQLHRLRDDQSLAAWLYKIARNTVMSHYRRSKRLLSLDEEENVPADIMEEYHLAIAPEDILDVHRAIESLNLPQREAITLHFLENFTLEEIADITQTPIGTIKSRLYHAKTRLRQALTESKPSDAPKGERHA
ncbi:MAG: sigma-70 family RNA polymerase sigma factor [Candidatus Omnitrophota bacterium]